MVDFDATDPHFVRDLQESKDAVARAAAWLSSKGYPVVIRPTFVRPDPSQMAEFSDTGDLEIVQRIEVKRRKNLRFTCAADYPHASLIVDVCHAYDNARPKPYAYLIFNHDCTAMAIVKGATFHHWTRERRTDRAKGRDRDFYFCPTQHAQFVAVQ